MRGLLIALTLLLTVACGAAADEVGTSESRSTASVPFAEDSGIDPAPAAPGQWDQEDAYWNGYEAGYEDGLRDGETRGYDRGYDDGYTTGYDEGFYDGCTDLGEALLANGTLSWYRW